jgi:hypothetical protein
LNCFFPANRSERPALLSRFARSAVVKVVG